MTRRRPASPRIEKPGLGLRRTDIPHRNRTPDPAHMKPEGRWTTPGTFTSYRSGMTVHYWNDVQLDFLTLMEVDPRVQRMRARPEPVRWHDGRAWQDHFPSFEIVLDDGPLLVEVDPSAGKSKAEVADSLRPVRRAAKLAGRRMVVFGRLHIRIEPRLGNAQVVCQCAGGSVPEADRVDVLQNLTGGSRETVDTLAARTGLSYGRCLAAAMNLVWRRIVSMENGRPVGPDTIIWRVS
ncbi:hypothetical protein [Bosea sp. TAF32]|uniref:hypothetical protein n=1 Tax=Bosea sp. TAF32 TaxID=3237482 RepID=UPI003F933B03